MNVLSAQLHHWQNKTKFSFWYSACFYAQCYHCHQNYWYSACYRILTIFITHKIKSLFWDSACFTGYHDHCLSLSQTTQSHSLLFCSSLHPPKKSFPIVFLQIDQPLAQPAEQPAEEKCWSRDVQHCLDFFLFGSEGGAGGWEGGLLSGWVGGRLGGWVGGLAVGRRGH